MITPGGGNRERAAKALRYQLGAEDVDRVAAALDAAEARGYERGRAEVAARVEELAVEFERRWKDRGTDVWEMAAAALRALTEPSQP